MPTNAPYVVNPAGEPMSVGSHPVFTEATAPGMGAASCGMGPYVNRARKKQFMLDLSTGELSILVLDNVLKVVQKDSGFYQNCRPPRRNHYQQKFFTCLPATKSTPSTSPNRIRIVRI